MLLCVPFLLLVGPECDAGASVGSGEARSPSDSQVRATGEAQSIIDLIDVLAELSALRGENDPNRVKSRLPKLYKMLSAKQSAIVERDVPFYRGECLILMGDPNGASAIAQEQLARGYKTPDILLMNMDSDRSEHYRADLADELGKVLPIGSWGRSRDRRLGGPARGLASPGPLYVPAGGISVSDTEEELLTAMQPGSYGIQEVLAAIASLYEKAGFTEEALNAYLEAAYIGRTSAAPSLQGQAWMKAAELERTRDNGGLAVRAYLKAVYNWHEYAERAKKGVIEVLSQNKPEGPEPKPVLRVDAAVTIATLYRKLRLHPFAMAALERSENDGGQRISDEKSKTLKEWQGILLSLERSRHDVGQDSYVFGFRASEVKDWAKIRIPRPTDTFWK